MTESELQLIHLRDDFYRDGYYKALVAAVGLLIAIVLLVSASLYMELSKPAPVTFVVADEFRTLLPVPVNKSYPAQADLIQWVSDALLKLFVFDFVNYNQQVKNLSHYFTENGWKNYSDQLKIYADYNAVTDGKLFVTTAPAGAPFIVNQGLLPSGAYGWLIQMPLSISYSSVAKGSTISLTIQALVERIPTVNNLSGVAIEKLTVTQGAGDQIISNG